MFSILLLAAVSVAEVTQPPMEEFIGVTHVAGTYHLEAAGGKDFLAEGADAVLNLGSRTIKIWFSQPQEKYPYNSDWPDSFSSLVEMAEHPYYKAIFERPFRCIVLLVYSLGRRPHYWTEGVAAEQLADETRQFDALTRHLLTTYKDSGKTFILQHWEGDWAIRGSYDRDQDPTQVAVDGMAKWLNARQAGVDRAREALGDTGVSVYHAAEVNLVDQAMTQDRPCVTNKVLPQTNLDLVSYSSYDTGAQKGDAFRKALDYIAEHMPDRAPYGNRNVYIGEYGWPENDEPEKHRRTVRNVVQTAFDWGCPYTLYWQLYCNDPRTTPVKKNDDVRGFWLIRPDGEKTWAWDYLHDAIASEERE
jgi:hypothetical protein